MLAFLYEEKGKVCSKDEIGLAVWPEYQEGVFDYQIENLVRRLRAKLESDARGSPIIVDGAGPGLQVGFIRLVSLFDSWLLANR